MSKVQSGFTGFALIMLAFALAFASSGMFIDLIVDNTELGYWQIKQVSNACQFIALIPMLASVHFIIKANKG